MNVVVIAGGQATRMKPLTDETPKCLLDVGGKPLLEHQVLEYKRQGYSDFIFCVAHMAEKVEGHFGSGSGLGVRIRYSNDGDTPLGTAGSVKNAEDLIGPEGRFIVCYGDVLTNMRFDRLVEFHGGKNAVATITLRPLPPGYRSSSVVKVGAGGEVTAFDEREGGDGRGIVGGRINSGIYVCEKDVFGLIPGGARYDFATQVFQEMIRRRLGLYGYETGEFYREIGRAGKYRAFLDEVRGRGRVFP